MRLDETKATTKTANGDLKEEFFGVGDLRVLLGILRHKMYSNTVK